ncbi:MAG: T9SS type A sorting domain-containing protein [Flavobacteriales bacterium]|nr:T9SS type A sorting domain-containing protein [Flavobacteriales bacterium]
MKAHLLLIGLLLGCVANAQHKHVRATTEEPRSAFGKGCLTDELRHRLTSERPEQVLQEEGMNARIRAVQGAHLRDGEWTIPVVVHIVHAGGEEDISDAQVLQALDHLNAAFNNEGAFATPQGTATGIRFCLAQRDPNGMSTSGITRTISGYTNLMAETDDEALKGTVGWPRTEYLNIWLVAEITSMSVGDGIAGYAYLPDAHGLPMDGIVNEARWFGSSIDNSKVHIHEVGHYLGLYHTFEGGCGNANCLENGDRVCDTPPDQSTAPIACNSSVNTCSSDSDDPSPNNPFRAVGLGGVGDVPELIEDYMDYGYQLCQDRFTPGQGERMVAALTEVRSSLLTSLGCVPGCAGTVAHLSPAPGEVLVNTAWTFTNTSVVVPDHSYAWYVDDVQVSTATDLVHTFTTDGTHTVVLEAFNTSAGCSDTEQLLIDVGCDAQALFTQAPMDVQPGGSVIFTSQGQGAQGHTWSVNGATVAAAPSLTWTFSEVGGYSVRLVVQGSGCTDTSAYAFVPVGDCVSGANNTLVVVGGSQVSFNSGEPVGLQQALAPFIGYEGVTSISDRYGNLLLYSDGIVLYNGQHQLIADSLPGGYSSAQAALLVQRPGSTTRFYLFMTDDQGSQNGGDLSYVEVDITANNGAGGLVGEVVTLLGTSTEKLCAVRHCDGVGIWVVGATGTDDRLSSFLVTPDGVQPDPVVSQTFLPVGSTLGCLKASPRGTNLALANYIYQSYSVMLYAFNNATGVVNVLTPLAATTTLQQYGVEFSPDGTKLYVTNTDDTYGVTNQIFQWDISSGLPGIIYSSKTLVGTSEGRWCLASMQTGPNGRIYVVMNQEPAMAEIRRPNEAGVACTFVDFAIPLASPTAGFGCSNFVPVADLIGTPMVIGPTQVCPGAGNTSYTLGCSPGEVSVTHAGPNAFLGSTGTSFTMDLQVAGTDTLFIATTAPCTILQADTFLIHVGAPQPDLGNDTTICSSASIQLDAGPGGHTFLWHDTYGERARSFTGPGVYSVTVTGVGDCTGSDTIVVSAFDGEAQLELPDPYLICANSIAYLHAPPGYASYEWSNGSSADSLLWYGGEGTVWLRVVDAQGCTAIDTTNIAVISGITVDLGPDGTLCPGQVRLLDAGSGTGLTYTWHNNSHEPTLTAYSPGTYWVRVEGCGLEPQQDTITFVPGTIPTVDLGADTLMCPGGPLLLTISGASGASYLWSDGTSGQTLLASVPGDYWLTVVDEAGCYATDTISIDHCSGIAITDIDGLSIHPNPAHDLIRVSSVRSVTHYELHDATGRRIRSANPGSRQFTVVRGDLAPGAYFITIHYPDGFSTRRVTLD